MVLVMEQTLKYRRGYESDSSVIIVVARYNSPLEAEIAKNILACAGIPSDIESDGGPAPYNYCGKIRLVVREEHSRQARTLLRIRE